MRRTRELFQLSGLSAWQALESFYHSDNLTYAASIAFYALLSLFPVLLLALALLGWATGDDAIRNAVFSFVLQYFPAQFDFITGQLASVRANPLTIGVGGTVALVWGALGVFGAITTAVNYAWGVEHQRSFWVHKAFSFLMLAFAGVTLLVAVLLVAAAHVVGASWFAGVLANFPALGILGGFTVRHLTTLLFMAVVGCVYYFVPNTEVRCSEVWFGAVLTGLLWKGALEGFTWFVGDMARFTRINGSIAAVVVFLLWVYLQAVILLYGAEFTAAYARLRRPALGRNPEPAAEEAKPQEFRAAPF